MHIRYVGWIKCTLEAMRVQVLKTSAAKLEPDFVQYVFLKCNLSLDGCWVQISSLLIPKQGLFYKVCYLSKPKISSLLSIERLRRLLFVHTLTLTSALIYSTPKHIELP